MLLDVPPLLDLSIMEDVEEIIQWVNTFGFIPVLTA
jgi:hypothetical protein